MSVAAWVTLALLAVMFGLLVKTRLPPWVIFLGAVALATALRLAPEEELLMGFSNSAKTGRSYRGQTEHMTGAFPGRMC